MRIALLAFAPLAGAAELRITLPQLPPLIESASRGPLAQLAQAIAKEWHEGKVTLIGPVPFDKSVDNLVSGRADMHLPMIQSPARYDDDLPYRYSSTTLWDVQFAVYTRRDNPRVNLKDLTIPVLSKLKLETDRAHARLFYFPLREADSIEAALEHVNAGKTDGYLFAMIETDAAIKRMGLKDIVRTPYRRFEVKMLLPKGPAGDLLDKKLSAVIDRIKASGQYQTIMAPLLTPPL